MHFLLYCLKIADSRKLPRGYNHACVDPRQNTTVSICQKSMRGEKQKFSKKSDDMVIFAYFFSPSFLKNLHSTVMWVT